MAIGLIGQKCGMSRIFTEDGVSVPVTVIKVDDNTVTGVQTVAKNGYTSAQLATGKKKLSRANKAEIGHCSKAEIEPARTVCEFKISSDQATAIKIGDKLTADSFKEGEIVDVQGVSKGKGFAGTIKRYNFTMGDATHGNSKSHRSAGSIGQNQDPGKVFKGKKMAGQMGNVTRTVQSLEVVKIDQEKGLLLVKGSVPGASGGVVIVRPSVKGQGNGVASNAN